MGERVLCKHEVVGSIPSGSTRRAVIGALHEERLQFVHKSFAWPKGLCGLSNIVKRKHIWMLI